MVEACFQTNTNAQSNLTGESRNVGKEDTTHFPETTPTPEIKREVPFDKELSLDKSKRLAYSLGIKAEINNPMTLAELTNFNDKSHRNEKGITKIGFK